jgi:DNA-directed RNA polymerase subunit beta
MEVWALEGFGAAFTLLEMLTVKSDDLTGRMTLWSNLILNKDLTIGTPEAFKVLICELQALCLDIGLFRYNPTNFTTFSLEKDKTNLAGGSSVLDSRPREATNAQSEKYIKGPQKSLTEMTSLMNFP